MIIQYETYLGQSSKYIYVEAQSFWQGEYRTTSLLYRKHIDVYMQYTYHAYARDRPPVH